MEALPKEKVVKELNFPTIIHAVLDINEFEEHVPKVINLLTFFEHKEVIIHPVCKSEEITPDTVHKLAKRVAGAMEKLSDRGITLYLENNSRLDPIFNTPEELEIMFSSNPELELLLDVAHIESYEHLERLIAVKMPKMLHIADKHFNAVHEHLPIGQGEIDYDYIFRNPLSAFTGKIILEVIQGDEAVISSREIIRNALSKR